MIHAPLSEILPRLCQPGEYGCAKGHKIPPKKDVGNSHNDGRHYVLVVDDVEVLAKGLAENLRMEGFEVGLAYNGLQAIELVQQRLPDLVITDVLMPLVDGHQLIAYLRHSIPFKMIPVISVSADPASENKDRCLRAGANFFMAKPFDDELLVATVIELLRQDGMASTPGSAFIRRNYRRMSSLFE
jgi:chemosensory pili system protein ChpA (sensor histidine kinase/response regulator)